MESEKNIKCIWEVEETKLFLKVCVEVELMRLMDKKTIRHVEIFKTVVNKLKDHGYDKTPGQCQLKFKTLKLKYYAEKKKLAKSGGGGTKFIYMELMQELLNNRPTQTVASLYGLDTSETTTPVMDVEDDENDENIGEPFDSSNPNQSKEKDHMKGKNNVGGRSKYEKVISGFSEKMAAQQERLQKEMFKKQDELFEKQKALELELQDREDERQRVYLQSLAEILNPQRRYQNAYTGHPSTTSRYGNRVSSSSKNSKSQTANITVIQDRPDEEFLDEEIEYVTEYI